MKLHENDLVNAKNRIKELENALMNQIYVCANSDMYDCNFDDMCVEHTTLKSSIHVLHKNENIDITDFDAYI